MLLRETVQAVANDLEEEDEQPEAMRHVTFSRRTLKLCVKQPKVHVYNSFSLGVGDFICTINLILVDT